MPEFPIGHTLSRGAFEITKCLQGEGKQQLFTGKAVAPASSSESSCCSPVSG